ncbi:subtilisin-like protease [Salvia miltiorrhiza]|uniref:subtilisin-like protease n=1 Tax=Salvia miltiorrhiza TaxID=226208 RepID=UPI0025AB8B39|nr:subtilisin-like protease [Salvia miltiorrhiza]
MACMILVSIISILTLYPSMAAKTSDPTIPQTYIVHVHLPHPQISPSDITNLYLPFLPKTTDPLSIIHSYRHVATGFAARLTPSQAKEMEKMEGFISARPQNTYTLHTTHAPNFLGLHINSGAWAASNYGKGVIIGVIDTGITPSHPSFRDDGMPPPPPKWKGKCELEGATCNNKLIGARNLVGRLAGSPALDQEGHGTLTSSTAAGSFVAGASMLGNANGTAAGIAPLAHLAVYKACSSFVCEESDILAAMDAAVDDGVDVISASLGRGPVKWSDDGVAIAAFAAIEKGIFVSCSADNGGPNSSTLANEFPWVLTVGASTTDRAIRAVAALGNGDEFDGESLFQPNDFSSVFLPLVDPSAIRNNQTAAYCKPSALADIDIKGKVVFCASGGGITTVGKGQAVKDRGGAAMIVANDESTGYSITASVHVLPAAHVSYAAGQRIKDYINSTPIPKATVVFKGTTIGAKSAPMVAWFSSRGPSLSSPGILKPDIIGSSVSIVAAWNKALDNDTSSVINFNMVSGTSISCPQLSGVAALIKSAHPDWSPAAVKSAIMTTAVQTNMGGGLIVDERLLPADVFAVGAGHVSPPKAIDPGLVYDINPEDYVAYLCGLSYTEKEIAVITRRAVSCEGMAISEAELNLPSFSVHLGKEAAAVYSRTVTNVGDAESIYRLEMESVAGVDVVVEPTVLRFTARNQKMTYRILFSRSASVDATYVQGSIAWVGYGEKHVVRAPISVKLL